MSPQCAPNCDFGRREFRGNHVLSGGRSNWKVRYLASPELDKSRSYHSAARIFWGIRAPAEAHCLVYLQIEVTEVLAGQHYEAASGPMECPSMGFRTNSIILLQSPRVVRFRLPARAPAKRPPARRGQRPNKHRAMLPRCLGKMTCQNHRGCLARS